MINKLGVVIFKVVDDKVESIFLAELNSITAAVVNVERAAAVDVVVRVWTVHSFQWKNTTLYYNATRIIIIIRNCLPRTYFTYFYHQSRLLCPYLV